MNEEIKHKGCDHFFSLLMLRKNRAEGAHMQYLITVDGGPLFETIDKSDFNPFLKEKLLVPQQ